MLEDKGLIRYFRNTMNQPLTSQDLIGNSASYQMKEDLVHLGQENVGFYIKTTYKKLIHPPAYASAFHCMGVLALSIGSSGFVVLPFNMPISSP